MKSTFRSTLKTRRALLATALVVAASGLVVASQASASHGVATLAGSNFEIDNNANLKVDDAPPASDWASIPQGTTSGTEIRGSDKATGQTDDSYVGGTKEDSVCPGETTGSIPNNKSDLLTLQAYQEPGVGTHPGFFNFAWSRVSDPSGTTLMDFEFNQGTTPCNGSPNIQRTIGDKLVEYSIDQGGARANITIRNWSGSAWGPATVLTDPSSLCLVSGNPAPCAAGTINSTTIPADQTDGLSLLDKQPRTFGEAQLDLRLFGGGGANPCVNFGYLTVKSRSSDSFTSQLKDFIKPTPIALGNCAKIVIHKVTDPAESTQSFGFTSTAPTSPATSGTFNLTGVTAGGANTKTILNVVPGSNYTVTEGADPTGWDFVSVDCSASSGVTPSIVGKVVTYSIDSASDVLECTYLNRQRGSITIAKVTDPTSSTQKFSFTSSSGLAGGPIGNGESYTKSNLISGTYDVAETPVAGWTLTNTVCSDSSPVSAISLQPGENITCTFTNQARGNIIVIKETDPDGSTQPFHFTTTGTGYTAGFSLVDNDGGNNSGPLAPGAYSVSEDPVAGWVPGTPTCASSIAGQTESAAALDLNPGETITCVFTNVQNASITVVKQVQGPDPGQTFHFTSSFGVPGLTPSQAGQGSFTASDLAPGNYSVTENGELNWLLTNADPAPGVTGTGGNVVCSDLSNSGAISLSAGEQVICTFVNQWQVGSIEIQKTAKHAGPGGAPVLNNIEFIVDDGVNAPFSVFTNSEGFACVGPLAFGNYTITEVVPDHYANADNVKVVAVDNVDHCSTPGGGESVGFDNIPLTRVAVSVDSLIDGGTASVVNCVDQDGNGIGVDGFTNSVGDGGPGIAGTFDWSGDLLPGVYTCTITIDP